MQDPDERLAADKDTKDSGPAGNTLPLPSYSNLSSPSDSNEDPSSSRTIAYGESAQPDSDTDQSGAQSDAGNSSSRPAPSNLPPLQPSELIPGFRIISELGRGAFGVVFKAIDQQLDRSVAIKLPLLKDVRLYEKYIVEARNAAKIESQGIVPILQVGTTESGQPFVVQKMIDGCTLADLLSAEGTLSVSRSVELAYKLASAIGSAHSAGLVHRDLKPANIIIDSSGEPWIADFGLAVFEEDQKFRHGEVAGTPTYMAPEQFLGRADWLDGRADIWALGIILHVMLTGKPPFEATNIEKLKEQILHRDPRPLNQRLPHLPIELDFVFRKCCAKAVKDRYSSAHQLADELLEFLQQWPDDSAPSSSQRSARQPMLAQRRFMGQQTVRDEQPSQVAETEPEKPTSKRPSLVVPLGIVALLVVAGLFLWQAFPWTNPSPELPGIVAEGPEPEAGSEDSRKSQPLSPPKAALQLRVSHAGTGSHATIAEALAVAEPGATVFIDAGTYRENLVIDRNVELRGEGKQSDVKILGTDASAIRLVGGSSLKLSNMTIEADGTEINTIEVQDGSLEMTRCVVKSNSLDCVIVRPKSQLRVLGDCAFNSGLHPAIFADQASVVEIRGSDFTFDPVTAESESPIGGIQIRRCGGIVSGCTFTGHPAATGIDWGDTDDRAIISECQFNELLRGIAVRKCTRLQIIGKTDNQMQGCEYGVVANACEGLVSQTAIFGSREKSSVGLKLIDCKNLIIKDIRCIAMDVGLEMKAGQAHCQAVTIKQSGEYGMLLHDNAHLQVEDTEIAESQTGAYLIQNSHLEMQGSQVRNNELAGIWVDTDGEALTATNCQIAGNGIGLVLTRGTTHIADGRIASNRSIGVLVRKPIATPKEIDASEQAPVELFANGVRVEAAAPPQETEATKGIFTAAVYFTTVGSYRLTNCEIVDASHENQVFLAANLVSSESDGIFHIRQK